MSELMRKHLAEIKAIAADIEGALDRGELPTIFDANIIEYRAQALAVSVRSAFVESLASVPERTPAEDKAAQRYIETRRNADGVTALLNDTAPVHSHDRDYRPEAAE